MGSAFAAPVEPPPDAEDPDLVVLREVVPLLEAGVATGFTSTVLLAAALLLRVVRRRGVGEGVAMVRKKWKRNGNGGGWGNSLSVRIPEIDDAPDGQIGDHAAFGAGKPGGGAAGREHPVALSGANRVNGNQLLALVVLKDAQVHVIQTGNPVGADQRSLHLHDLHQLFAPPPGVLGDADGAGAAVLGGSGSQ